MTLRSRNSFRGSDRYRLRYEGGVPAPSEKAVAFFVQKQLRERYKLKPEDRKRALPGEATYQSIADDLGVTKPQVHQLINDCPRGFGPKFEEQFARKFYGGSIDKLRREAEKWWAEWGEAVIIADVTHRSIAKHGLRPAPDKPKPGHTFIEAVDAMPGFRDWLEDDGRDFTFAQIAKAVDVYVDHKPRARDDGQPLHGWRAFVEDALADRHTKKLRGDVEGVAALELSQLPSATRRRLRNASKKR